MPRLVRLPDNEEVVVEFSREVYALVHRLAAEEGISVSTVVNRCVQVYGMIVDVESPLELGRRRWGFFWQAKRIIRPRPSQAGE